MISVMQASYFPDMLDTAWPFVPTLDIDEKTSADTLVTPGEETNTTSHYPVRTSDDKSEADRLIIDMLCADVPLFTIRSIVHSDSYDIIPPKDTTTAPFLVITYADETDEDICVANNNWEPRQDASFLQVPNPGMTTEVHEEPEELEIGEDTRAGFEWSLDVDMESYDYPSVDRFPTLALDSPFGIPINLASGWPSDLNTRYFVGCTRRRGPGSTARWLNMRASTMESCTTVDPWKPAKFGSIPAFAPHVVKVQLAMGTKTEVEDWSDDFEMGEEGGLDFGAKDDGKMNSSYDEDTPMCEDTESALAELTDSECGANSRVVVEY